MTDIGNANDKATILADAKTFFSSHFADTDENEIIQWIEYFDSFAPGADPRASGGLFWYMGAFPAALIQVYDLVLPVDLDQARTYISRLNAIAFAMLENRDDNRNNPMDPFRGRVMPAWGGLAHDRDDQWNTDVVTSGLFVYAMAAFARRVVDRPHLYPDLHTQAIAYITASIETYQAFRQGELHLVDGDPFAWFFLPLSYSNLTCGNGADYCPGYRAGAGKAISYNENLGMMQALAELALAANSNVYRASSDATPERLALATEEAPLVVARNVAWRVSNLRPKSLTDLTPYYEWDYSEHGEVEDIHHANFELGCLAVIFENQIRLNALLAAAGQAERIPLDRSTFVRFANTFLRKVWHSSNDLGSTIDGQNVNSKNDSYCAGWIPLAQFDPWVWTRARDTTFNTNAPALSVDSHGALLRYRAFNSMKYLTDFAGQNWLITPAALAVGQTRPRGIRDQKWMLVLSGVVIANLKGDNSGDWNRQTVSFIPDMAGTDDPTSTSGPLNWAISHYNIPKPSGSVGTDYLIRFALEGWSPFVSLGSVYDEGQSINAGFAVDVWRPNHFDSGTDVVTGQPVNNIFTGVNADLAVSDSDAWLYRFTYNITLIGKIVFIAPPVIF